jgi:hypothetical protein
MSNDQNQPIQRVFRPQFPDQPNRESLERKQASHSRKQGIILAKPLPVLQAAIVASLTGVTYPRSTAAIINKLPGCWARSSIQGQLQRLAKAARSLIQPRCGGTGGAEGPLVALALSGRSPDRRQCWGKTRHAALKSPCPLFAQKRALLGDSSMSALCQKRKSRPSLCTAAACADQISFDFQLTKNTPRTHTAMPRNASGASRSSNSSQAISAVTGGVR